MWQCSMPVEKSDSLSPPKKNQTVSVCIPCWVTDWKQVYNNKKPKWEISAYSELKR